MLSMWEGLQFKPNTCFSLALRREVGEGVQLLSDFPPLICPRGATDKSDSRQVDRGESKAGAVHHLDPQIPDTGGF